MTSTSAEGRPVSLRELSAELGWPEPDQALLDSLDPTSLRERGDDSSEGES